MNVLIVDDTAADRRMLSMMSKRVDPGLAVAESENLGAMWSVLRRDPPPDLVFLDINFRHGEGDGNDDGLRVLYDLVEHHPHLPLCMVTGFFQQNVRSFLGGFLSKTLQVVGFLDKGNYGEPDLQGVFDKAAAFRAKWEETESERKTIAEILDEEIRRQEQVLKERHSKELHMAELYRKAMTSENWEERLLAEHEINGRKIKLNGPVLCVRLEAELKRLCQPFFNGRDYEKVTFLDKEQFLLQTRKMDSHEMAQLKKAWFVRCAIVHAEKVATLEEARNLLETCKLLEGT